MRQKGNNFVEYALMLGLVVGIGWGVLGSYGDGIPRVFGSAAELLQAGSKSDKVYDRHMKWLKDALLALAQKEPGSGVQSVFDYMGGTNGSYFDALLLYHLPKGDGIIPRGKSVCHPWHPYGGLSSFRVPPAE